MIAAATDGKTMSLALYDDAQTGMMSAAEFMAFYDTRPDGERWELVAGVPIMMTATTIAHQVIGSNLERLLNDAMEILGRRTIALQRSGVEITTDDYRPEPDLVVVDADFAQGQRYNDRVYLMAETISKSDRFLVPGRPARWIDVKRDIYRAHPACEAIVFVEQDQFDVLIDLRGPSGWTSQRLTDPLGVIELPPFGLRCAVRDLYKRTPLYRTAQA